MPANQGIQREEARLACLPNLKAQIAAKKPRIIVCMGNVVVQALIDPEQEVKTLRGRCLREYCRIMWGVNSKVVGKMEAEKLPKTAAEKLPREFYERDVVTVARELLGKTLAHANAAGVTRGIIVEAEAYRGPEDRAAHSYGNLRSKRTSVMFGPGGHAYVFLIYGMYCCFNVVAATTDQPQAVLIRALEPLDGIDLMAARRGVAIRGEKDVRKLASGPGKLTSAMGINMSHNGLDLCGDELYITAGRAVAGPEIAATRRINVGYAGEWKDRPWRFVIRDSPFLSVKKLEQFQT